METSMTIGKRTYAGVFLTSLSALMLEILMTRIFSVTMWYHFAFMAISIAMFGMTVGAVAVFLKPDYYTAGRAKAQMAQNALLFSLWSLFSFLVHLQVRFHPEMSPAGLASTALTFGVLAMPFVFAGICVTIALTRFPAGVSRLYAADLAGAAAGCILLAIVLGPLDGPTALVLVAFSAGLGALLFAGEAEEKGTARQALAVCLLLAAIGVINTAIPEPKDKLLAVKWVKGVREQELALEKWSSYARVAVRRRILTVPLGWGLSDLCPLSGPVRQLYMDIDATAGTVLTEFHGDLGRLEFLKYDITNIAHWLRPQANILVVGTGGGRDILSALAFAQRRITGVEINRDIIDAVNRTFGDFTGHLDRRPGVRFVNDEARSYLTRSRERYDLIQLSLIDTWSATAAGAFVLSENALYTADAWRVFVKRLAPAGILTVSRWFTADPAEMYRLTSLAARSLRDQGDRDPGAHLIIVRHMLREYDRRLGVGTLLMNRRPFTAGEVAAVREACRRMGFDLVLAPGMPAEPAFAALASPARAAAFISAYPLDIAAPTDDRPFFFNMLRLKNAFSPRLWLHSDRLPFNTRAVLVLGVLLVVILFLVALGIGLPLVLASRRLVLRGAPPFLLFFSAIGMGFMMIEVAQMQRLCVFLGHPSYGLTVVLFSLLLSCSLGSFLTRKTGPERAGARGKRLLGALLLALLACGMLTPPLLAAFRGAATPLRVLVAVGLLFPPGMLMGTAFPLGMLLARRRQGHMTPWYWGVNGAASVLASVLAMIVSLGWGISASFWAGLAGYAAAFAAIVVMIRNEERNRDA
jgi:hypothetical protein